MTDSTAYLPAELVRAGPVPITVVPLHVVMGGKAHREGVDVTLESLSEALRAFLPLSTSRPSPQEFLDAYEAAAASGASAVVSVHISSEMSGTCQSARLAAEQAPIPVEVVDSRSLGMAMGFGVLSAAEAAGDGLSAPEVAEIARGPGSRRRRWRSTSTPWSTCDAAVGSGRRRRCWGRRSPSSPS